jgi:hypothetical protein
MQKFVFDFTFSFYVSHKLPFVDGKALLDASRLTAILSRARTL